MCIISLTITSSSCCSMSDSLWLHERQHTGLFFCFTTSWSWLKFKSIESMMVSNHLILCCPLLLPSVFPSIRVFSNESALHIRWPKYWSFSISPSNEYSGLISFRSDWFGLPAVQGTLKSLLQHYNSKHQFFTAQPSLWSSSHIVHDYWKNYSFDCMHFCRPSRPSDISAF